MMIWIRMGIKYTAMELSLGTDPGDADSDNDGLSDSNEIMPGIATDPLELIPSDATVLTTAMNWRSRWRSEHAE
ncbi:MAG: hypothetical protein R3E95_18665 [Thiolinea sp.]